MTILVQQQLREATERLIAEGENCWPATVERFTALANPAAVLALLDELDQLKAENAELRAQTGLQILLPELDDALEHLEMHGLHSDQGYRKLKDWFRKVSVACKAIDQAMTKEQP